MIRQLSFNFGAKEGSSHRATAGVATSVAHILKEMGYSPYEIQEKSRTALQESVQKNGEHDPQEEPS